MAKHINHLTLRAAWHDNRWNGCICKFPSENAFCTDLKRIRAEKDGIQENLIAGKGFWDIDVSKYPPCKAESGVFMNSQEWRREFKHPYQGNPTAAATHGNLIPTTVTVPEYSTFAVPFRWMLNQNQEKIQETLPEQLPEDISAPFHSPWIFGKERQKAILELFFNKLTPENSLVFFYTKAGHPIGDEIPRLILGVGSILRIGPILFYRTTDGSEGYPFWDRIISHSIRPDEENGFLLPYHDYLEMTDDPVENDRRNNLLKEIAIPADSAHMIDFSYAAEITSPDVALTSLVSMLNVVRKIRQHGIAKGPWEQREEWLNRQISNAWKDRGAFPGTGAALETIGLRLGTSLIMDLFANDQLEAKDNPWLLIDAIFRGEVSCPVNGYQADIDAVRNTWINLDEDRRSLLRLLSRFDLSLSQIKRWFDQNIRQESTRSQLSDSQIIKNPYVIVENDLGDIDDSPISIEVIDRGMMPESTIVANHPVPAPSTVDSPNDVRRIRAAISGILLTASEEGDSLLSQAEVLEKLTELPLQCEMMVGSDWIDANINSMGEVIEKMDLLVDQKSERKIAALQLKNFKEKEDYLRTTLIARANRKISSPNVDWKEKLENAITEAGGKIQRGNYRHSQALSEQAEALEKITSRKMSILTGKAGTGKTSVIGALLGVNEIVEEGVLLLAPTGKARVRLAHAAQAEAQTIAQFLYSLKRYDGIRQRPLFDGGEKYQKQKNIIIDECSMLTLDDLFAVLKALDLAHVKRIILVGDSNQLPPIGVGRPFADFIGYLDNLRESKDEESKELSGALARLTIELRSAEGAPSDTLRLASWFTREVQPVDADRVLSDLEIGKNLNDLEICFWNSTDELHQMILTQFQNTLGLENDYDVKGFNKALGLNDKGWVPYEDPNGAENFQILSPVRMNTHGAHDLNRWIQSVFRSKELQDSRQPWGKALGDEELVIRDKVIQIQNQRRKGYNNQNGEQPYEYIANGEIGVIAREKNGYFNVMFANRPYLTFGFSGKYDFKEGAGPLELAYALTIHKAQGSDFNYVFVVLPKTTRLLSRELIYTALTRSKNKLILLIEGNDPSFLYEYSRSEKSNTANRNTNLFTGAIREKSDEIPYNDHLIHKTLKGHMVRSKSELVIANILYENNIEYQYEREYQGDEDKIKVHPDFSFTDPAGDLILWEHLGMLSREDYRLGWEWKKDWYERNGFVENKNLFTTRDGDDGSLDSSEVKEIAEKINKII